MISRLARRDPETVARAFSQYGLSTDLRTVLLSHVKIISFLMSVHVIVESGMFTAHKAPMWFLPVALQALRPLSFEFAFLRLTMAIPFLLLPLSPLLLCAYVTFLGVESTIL